mgnify:CR=1 FL=1
MKERLRILRQNLQEMWTKMTERNRKIVLGAAAALGVGIIAAIVFLVVSAHKPGMSVLYSNLSGNDAHAIVETLQKNGVKYEIADDGKTIKVYNRKGNFLKEVALSRPVPELKTGPHQLRFDCRFPQQAELSVRLVIKIKGQPEIIKR